MQINIITKQSKQAEHCVGAEILDHDSGEFDVSKITEVKIRSGWDGFSNAYGKLEIRTKE